jgi:hypothetical protein
MKLNSKLIIQRAGGHLDLTLEMFENFSTCDLLVTSYQATTYMDHSCC